MKGVIIIGSGLGGLECGYILAREGYHVLILERERQPAEDTISSSTMSIRPMPPRRRCAWCVKPVRTGSC